MLILHGGEHLKEMLGRNNLSQYPAVNAQTRQDIFRVIAPSAQTVQIDLAKN
jgi:hypothetical protein